MQDKLSLSVSDLRSFRKGRKASQALGIFLFLASQGNFAVAQEQPTGLPPGAAIVCVSEQSIGFRWIKGQWKSTDFITDSYEIEKRPTAGAAGGGCWGMSAATQIDRQGGEVFLPGCYSIRRHGESPKDAREQICSERMVRENGRWVIRVIDCETFKFRPNGWFHRTSLHDNLADRPVDDFKNPLSVTVGHCRTVR
jgi:hypothetical protein